MKIYKEDLQFYDWVLIKDFPIKAFPEKFEEQHCQKSLCEFESIELTKEILLLNGFELHVNLGTWSPSIKIEDDVLHFDETNKNILVWNGIEIKHVYILQHLLRLCGYKEFANNLKIIYDGTQYE